MQCYAYWRSISNHAIAKSLEISLSRGVWGTRGRSIWLDIQNDGPSIIHGTGSDMMM